MSSKANAIRSFFGAMLYTPSSVEQTEKRAIKSQTSSSPAGTEDVELHLDRQFAETLVMLQDLWIESEDNLGMLLPKEISFDCSQYGAEANIIEPSTGVREMLDAEIVVSPAFISLRFEGRGFDFDPEDIRAVAEGSPLPSDDDDLSFSPY